MRKVAELLLVAAEFEICRRMTRHRLKTAHFYIYLIILTPNEIKSFFILFAFSFPKRHPVAASESFTAIPVLMAPFAVAPTQPQRSSPHTVISEYSFVVTKLLKLRKVKLLGRFFSK